MPDDITTVETIFEWKNGGDDRFHKDEFMVVETDEEGRPGMLNIAVGGFCGEPGCRVRIPMADVARLVQALVKLPMVQELKGHPVVLWLPTKEAAQEFVGIVKNAMSNLRSVDIG